MPPSSLPCGGVRRAAAALALLLAALASACGGLKDTEFPPACPGLALVPDGGDLTRFDGHGQDITNVVLQARIIAVPAKCEPDKPGLVRATLHIDADAMRGPAGTAASVPIDYFIALVERDKVLNEQDFSISPTFPPNVDRTSLHGEEIELLLPVSKTKSAAAYQIFVGFRLTRDELAYNRTHPRP